MIEEKFHYDESNDRLTIERIQDVEPIIEANKDAYNWAPTHWKNDFNKVASIPLVVIEKYKNETGIDLLKDKDELRKFLNDPNNKFMRTKPGVV